LARGTSKNLRLATRWRELAHRFSSSGVRGTASRAGTVARVAVVASPSDGAFA
jgi:hypothetical protein